MSDRVAASRSPLKRKYLHHAGQSLDEEISRLLDEEVRAWVIWVLLILMFCIVEWTRWALPSSWHPVCVSFLATVAVAVAGHKIVKAKKKLRALRLGRDGEREVGEQLDELPAKGYTILHDLVWKDFNVDHLIVSPTRCFYGRNKDSQQASREESCRGG